MENERRDPGDEPEIAAVLERFYAVLSGPAGQPRDGEALRALFVPGAILLPCPPGGGLRLPAAAMDMEAYVRPLQEGLARQDFFERGTVVRVDRHGDIAAVVSTYEARRAVTDRLPFKRGVCFVHLLRDGEGRWRVTSMIWQDAVADRAAPE